MVAFGTSAPELVVSIQANLKDPPKGDIALGNIVGSNICNIALILGVGALIRPIAVHLQIVRREMPFLIVISVVFLLFLRGGVIERWEGGLLFLGVILFSWANLRQAKAVPDSLAHEEFAEEEEEAAAAKEAGASRILMDLLLIVVGIAGLVYGADRLVYGGSNLAAALGISEAVVALTVVAFGTSLPELATSVVAAARRQGDLIIGNAIGSCIFNLLCVVGLTGLVAPLTRTPDLRDADLAVMMAITVLIYPFLRSGKSLSRVEGGILLLGYLAYVVSLALRGGA